MLITGGDDYDLKACYLGVRFKNDDFRKNEKYPFDGQHPRISGENQTVKARCLGIGTGITLTIHDWW